MGDAFWMVVTPVAGVAILLLLVFPLLRALAEGRSERAHAAARAWVAGSSSPFEVAFLLGGPGRVSDIRGRLRASAWRPRRVRADQLTNREFRRATSRGRGMWLLWDRLGRAGLVQGPKRVRWLQQGLPVSVALLSVPLLLGAASLSAAAGQVAGADANSVYDLRVKPAAV